MGIPRVAVEGLGAVCRNPNLSVATADAFIEVHANIVAADREVADAEPVSIVVRHAAQGLSIKVGLDILSSAAFNHAACVGSSLWVADEPSRARVAQDELKSNLGLILLFGK